MVMKMMLRFIGNFGLLCLTAPFFLPHHRCNFATATTTTTDDVVTYDDGDNDDEGDKCVW